MNPPPTRCSNPKRWALIDRIQDEMAESWAGEYGVSGHDMREIAGIITTRVVIEIRKMSKEPEYFESFCAEAFEIAKIETKNPGTHK